MTNGRSRSALRPLATAFLVFGLVLALTGVAAAAPGGKPGKADPTLVGAWLFDEGTGDYAFDRTANGNDGLIAGPTWTKGRIAGALAFDGLYDRVVVPRSAVLEPATVSVSMWFRTSVSPGRYRVLMYKGVIDCTASSYSLKADAWGTGIVFMTWDGTQNRQTPAAAGVWDGAWHHVVGTYDGTQLALYLDGTLVGTTPMTTGIRYGLTHGDELVVGHPANLCGDYQPQFEGAIDEVKVWSRAITASEVLTLATPRNGRK